MREVSYAETQQIRSFCDERKVRELVHFTKFSNLHSIFVSGLLPRSELDVRLAAVAAEHGRFSDPERRDGHRDAVCLSISFPNYRMLYKCKLGTPGIRWAVISLKPEILWELPCAFYPTNAGTGVLVGKQLLVTSSPMYLRRMYSDRDEYSGNTREDLAIPGHFTTNPTAEVLVFTTIAPAYFQRVYLHAPLKSSESQQDHEGAAIPFEIDPFYFGPRSDYPFWS